MKYYARVVDGRVFEVIAPFIDNEGLEVPIEQCFSPEFVALLTEIIDQDPMPEQGWAYDGANFYPYVEPENPEGLAYLARLERDRLLRDNYDRGILMALRALRMATTPEEVSYAEGKIVELDLYAQALQEVPDQVGFPNTIVWPTVPVR